MNPRILPVLAVLLAACRSGGPDPVPALVAPLASRPPEPPPAGLAELSTLWNFDDPAASETRFRDAAARAKERGARGYEAEAWTQVARAEALQKRCEDAHATLAVVEGMLRPEHPAAIVRWNLEKGRTLRSSGRPKDAEPFFVTAWDRASAAGDLGLALDAAHMVALTVEGERPDEALSWANRAIALAEASSDPAARGWLAPLYNNTGWTCFDRGDFGRALDLWQKAVPLREKGGDAAALRIARWNVARCLRALKRPGDAVKLLETLRTECEVAGKPDGFVFEELAENALVKGDAEAAKPYFQRAYELLKDDPDLASDKARLERLRTAAGSVK